jgi:lysozyme family protein
MPTNAVMIAANLERWEKAKITRPGFAPVAQRLDAPAAKARYLAVTAKTSVPFQVIAVTHQRECSQSWSGSLAQGDPISRPSVHVPAGRPAGTWEAVAVDALMNCAPYAGHWTDWSTGGMLTLLEKYNGVGYAAKGRPSPYIWSGTDQYTSGKYVRDGVYDPNVVDAQLGCAGLLKAMMEIDPSIQFGPPGQPQRKTPEPPKQITDEATKGERKTRKGAIAGSAAGGANEGAKTAGTTEKPASGPLLPSFVAYNFIAVGIVVAIVATVLIKRKTDAIKAIW